MNNYFKLSHQQQLSAHTQLQLNSQDSRTLNRSRKMMQLAAESLSRIGTYQIFIAQPTSLLGTRSGTIPLIMATQHNFRDRNKLLELGALDMTMKTYKPAKERATDAQSEFIAAHLEHEIYDTHQHDETRITSLKDEHQPMRFAVHETRCEVDRIQQNIDASLVDHTASDLKMKHFPEWKTTNANKWMYYHLVTKRDKKYFSSLDNGPDARWYPTPIYEPHQDNTYLDGFDKIGDTGFRRRIDLEGGRPVFNAVNCDQGKELIVSQSLRTHKQDEALGLGQFAPLTSPKQKPRYTLGKTKSVETFVAPGRTYQEQKSVRYEKHYRKSALQFPPVKKVYMPPLRMDELSPTLKTVVLDKIQEDQHQTKQFTKAHALRSPPNQYDLKSMGYPYHQLNNGEANTIISKYFKEI